MTSRGENRYTNLNSKVWRKRFSELDIYLSQYNQPSIQPDMHSENIEVTTYQNTINNHVLDLFSFMTKWGSGHLVWYEFRSIEASVGIQ